VKIDYMQLDYYHPKLKEVLSWIEEHLGFGLTITSQYRVGSMGVHGTLPLRANDLRCRSAIVGRAIEDVINSYWSYDPNREEMNVCIFHDVGSGPHLHIQVHDRTVMR
jgi:hypothetical protein